MDSRLKRAAIRGGLIGVAFASMLATAATFNLFQPANGILKGSSSTYITTAAVTSDVTSLWSGSCSSSTYLRGDGQCQTPPGTGGGTVNSVALTMPSGFSVGGSPVTSTGTLAVTTTLNGILKGDGSGFTTGAAADIVALFSTCSGTQYLGADGACHTPGTVTSVALADGSTSPIFTISGSPVTGSGTLTETLSTQSANFVFAGPTTGAAAQPAFRALVSADIPPVNLASTANGGITGNLPFAHLTITSANIISLWTGTCNSSSFMRGDGACASPGGGGTVTSIDVAGPAGFNSSGGPITSSGTITLGYAGGQTANSFLATPNGTTGALSIRTIVAGDLPGSITSNTSGNAATATALASAPTQCTTNYAIGIAVSGNAVCSSTISPTMTGTWTFSFSTGAPIFTSSTAGNNLINLCNTSNSAGQQCFDERVGSTGSYTLSTATDAQVDGHAVFQASRTGTTATLVALSNATDNAPVEILGSGVLESSAGGDLGTSSLLWGNLFSQHMCVSGCGAWEILGYHGGSTATLAGGTSFTTIAIGANVTATPWCLLTGCTITGDVAISPSSAVALTTNGVANNWATIIDGSPNTSQSLGLLVKGGTNYSDRAMNVQNAAGSTTFLQITGDGGVVIGSPTEGEEGPGTLNVSGGLFVNGVPVLTSAGAGVSKIAAAGIAGTASSCTVTGGAGIASCAANGSGQWAMTFTASFFSTTPICTASGNNSTSSNNGIVISSPSSSVFDVISFATTTGSLVTTSNFYVTCVGS